MSQCHFRIDGMTARHTENLQVRVLTITFIHLQTGTKHFYLLLFQLHFKTTKSDFSKSNLTGKTRPIERAVQLMQAAHLLVLLNCLLLGLGNDAFKFVKTSLHICEAQTGILLFPADALQLLLTMLLSDAGTLLPLLDTLREDLIDPAVDAHRLTSVKVKWKNVFLTFVITSMVTRCPYFTIKGQNIQNQNLFLCIFVSKCEIFFFF